MTLTARHQRVVAEFEADLVVAFAGGAVGTASAPVTGDLDLALGDQRTGDGGAQQVFAFINGVAAEHRKTKSRTNSSRRSSMKMFSGLMPNCSALRGPVRLFTLAEVGGEGHHFALIGVLQTI